MCSNPEIERAGAQGTLNHSVKWSHSASAYISVRATYSRIARIAARCRKAPRARPCAGHPCLLRPFKTWMTGTSPVKGPVFCRGSRPRADATICPVPSALEGDEALVLLAEAFDRQPHRVAW